MNLNFLGVAGQGSDSHKGTTEGKGWREHLEDSMYSMWLSPRSQTKRAFILYE